MSDTTDKSGSSPLPEEDPHSASRSRSEESKSDPHSRIIIVDDHPPDVALIREAIDAAGIEADLSIARDGEQATDLIDAVDRDDSLPRPALIVLDINLPKKNGAEVLTHIRASRRSRDTKVLVVSTSQAESDRARMKALGADDYFQKPSNYAGFLKLGDVVRDLLQ